MPTQPAPQTFANHRRNRPLYLVVYFLLFLNILWTAYRAIWTPSIDTVNAALALEERAFLRRKSTRIE